MLYTILVEYTKCCILEVDVATNKKRVIKYKKKRKINVGIFIFAFIFIYMVSYIIMYVSRDRISMYEVVYGKNAQSSNKTYTALLLRNEKVYKSSSSGYLNLFVREGEKTAVDETVYTIDESGTVQDLLAQAADDDNTLSKEDLKELQKKIFSYSTAYENVDFFDVYNFKADIEASVMEYINLNTISNVNDILGENTTSSVFKIVKADLSGVVSYVIDGYEGKDTTNITASDFKKSNYSKKIYKSNDLVDSNAAIYKVVNSENWEVAFSLNEEDVSKYSDDDMMKIKFMEDGIEAVGDFKIITIDGASYGVVSLDQYMVRYISSRFADIQIVEDDLEGLKIPKTSVVQKEFYTIPKEYATEGGNSTDIGFLLQTYDDNGKATTSFVKPEIFHATETDYYVAKEVFETGNVLIKPNSTETYTVSNIATLVGVYNINNGYCVFREINIIAETSEYYIVESGTTYGLLVYDHIVLDSSKVKEDQIVYQ